MTKKITKRDFIRYSLLGMGASMVNMNSARSLAKGIINLGSLPHPGGLWKWSKESPYYLVTPKGVQCQICPNRCTLKEGEESVCRARTVYKGKLYSIAYGNPCFIFSRKAGATPLQPPDARSPALIARIGRSRRKARKKLKIPTWRLLK